tara:strand:- start:1812 stop:2144 length:333 start_codon:yes stop_codon:yes gene_type:complete
MAKKARARVKVPKSIKSGTPFLVKTLISHKMETGFRTDKKTGKKVPRHILNKFVAKMDGKEVFSADWHPAVSANPYTAFYMVAEKSGQLELSWTDDKGEVFIKNVDVKVE